jgi:hypothetical protein
MVLGAGLISVVAWASVSAGTMVGGVVAAVAAGLIVSSFDYFFASVAWFLAESIIALFSLPAAFFSVLANMGLNIAKNALQACAHAFGIIKLQPSTLDKVADNALADLLPDSKVVYFIAGVLLFFVLGPLAVFAIPALLLSGIVELADRVSSMGWIHRSVMALRNFFTAASTKTEMPNPKAVTPQPVVDITVDEKAEPKTKFPALAPLTDVTPFTLFEVRFQRDVTRFGNISSRVLEENPYHKENAGLLNTCESSGCP